MMTIAELQNHLDNYGIQTSRPYLERAMRRYHYFGDDIFKVYENHLDDFYHRSDRWFLLEMSTPAAFKYRGLTTVFNYLLQAKDVKWDKIYAYYDEVGHDKFGLLGQHLDKHRYELTGDGYDIV